MPPVPACCVRQVTYESDLSGVTDPKLPQHSQQHPLMQMQMQMQTQTHRSSGDFLVPPVQLHGSAGAAGNLAALRAMAAPSDTDGSDDMNEFEPASGPSRTVAALRDIPGNRGATAASGPAAPALQDFTDDCGVAAASKGADAQETEELELIRMEQLWIRVQELEVEYALLGKCWILHAIQIVVNSDLGWCSTLVFIPPVRCACSQLDHMQTL